MERLIELKEGEDWTPFLQEANRLFIEEKKARHDNDNNELVRLCKQIVQLCFDNGDLERMCSFIIALTKKRGQAKRAIVEMVNYSMELATKLPHLSKQKTLLNTLRTVTEGKLFLEVEYARCSRQYCDLLLGDKDLPQAAEVIQEVQVETYGSMEKKEKVAYVLFQIKLMFDCKDFVRMYIISKKIDTKNLNEEGFEELKVQFYFLMIKYYLQEDNSLELSKAYRIIFETMEKAEGLEAKFGEGSQRRAFENFMFFLLSSENSPEKTTILSTTTTLYKKELAGAPILDKYVKFWSGKEIMPIFEENIERDIGEYEPFNRNGGLLNSESHYKGFLREIIQWNLQVIERYYNRIRISRIGELLNVSVDRIEEEIREMVYKGLLSAKIDRPKGIVEFRRAKKANDVMNEWGFDITQLLKLVDDTCHLINREHITNQNNQSS